MNNAALEVENFTINYGKLPVLWDLNFSLPQGKLIGILGPNGAGKSTLLKGILELVSKTSGTVRFLGKPLKKMKKSLAYVPQKESIDWEFPLSVYDLAEMGCYGRRGLFRRVRAQDKAFVKEQLDKVGLTPFASRQINALSGGQKQRAFMARALVQRADIYLLDEPLVGIDMVSTEVICNLLKELRAQGKTILMVHHDLKMVPDLFDWVLMLNKSVVACGEVEEVFSGDALPKTFGQNNELVDRVAKLLNAKARGVVQP